MFNNTRILLTGTLLFSLNLQAQKTTKQPLLGTRSAKLLEDFFRIT